MEKGYRDYGHDIDNTDTVLEAGLGFAVALDKPGGFIGRDAVLAQKARGPLTRRLVQVLVKDPEPLMFHAEVVRRDGRPAGYIRSASYGFTLGGAVGLAMIDAGEPIDQAYLDAGEWTVQIGPRSTRPSRRCARCTTRGTSASGSEPPGGPGVGPSVSAVQDGGLQVGVGVDLGLGESFGDPLVAGVQDGLVG